MKIYNKSDVQFFNGYIVKGNKSKKVIGIDNEIVDLFNKIEYDYQRAKYLAKQPKVEAGDYTFEDFKFEHNNNDEFTVTANTPYLDRKIAETLKIMDDLDAITQSDRFNDYINGIKPVMQFIDNDFIVSCDQHVQHKFDTKYLGNPLEMTIEDIVDCIATIVGIDNQIAYFDTDE